MEGNWPHPTETESKEETFLLEQIPPLPTTDPPPFPAHHPMGASIVYANPLTSFEPAGSYTVGTSPKVEDADPHEADEDTPMDCTLESNFRKQDMGEEEDMMDVGGGRTPTRSPPPADQDMDTPTDYRTSCKLEEPENLVKPVIRPLLNTMLYKPAILKPANLQPAQTQPARPSYSGSDLTGLNFRSSKPGSSTHLARSFSVHNRPTYHMAGGNMAGVAHTAVKMDLPPSCLLPKSGILPHSNISQTHSLPPLHHQDYESEHHSPKKSAKSSTIQNSIPPPAFPNPLRNTSQGSVGTATPSPLPLRNAPSMVPSPSPLRNAPSPDSAFHSEWYSPSLSPLQSRRISEYSSSCQSSSHRTTPSLSRNNSDASLYGGSQFSYNSAPSPLDSPATSRHYPSPALPSSPLPRFLSGPPSYTAEGEEEGVGGALSLNAHAGISRQQLINSPCPICGDKISGFHYGIFSCESCKGFFKRTVQNKKNYICMRGASCQVTIATRKKCPACRYEKCLKMGMKLEAIREDRTRGGRSTYQCTYTLPQVSENETSSSPPTPIIPNLLQEIMNVEHLWCGGSIPSRTPHHPTRTVGLYRSPSLSIIPRGPLGGGCGMEGGPHNNLTDPDFNTGRVPAMPDQLLYQLVKWCKSLPLLKNISIDDQSALLINAWCELLVLSACYRSINTPGYIWVSNDTRLSYAEAKERRLDRWVERMLSFTDQLRRLKVDDYEYVSMKVIVLLTADTSDLRNKDQVRESQEKVVHALQGYTLSHYPELPAKFGEILLRMPELNRVSQVIFSSGAEKGILEFLKFL